MADNQDQINYGQARINFDLCEVDKRLIGILKEVVEALKNGADTTGSLKQVDFDQLEKALEEAYNASVAVAAIDPPGCQGPPYPN